MKKADKRDRKESDVSGSGSFEEKKKKKKKSIIRPVFYPVCDACSRSRGESVLFDAFRDGYPVPLLSSPTPVPLFPRFRPSDSFFPPSLSPFFFPLCFFTPRTEFHLYFKLPRNDIDPWRNISTVSTFSTLSFI